MSWQPVRLLMNGYEETRHHKKDFEDIDKEFDGSEEEFDDLNGDFEELSDFEEEQDLDNEEEKYYHCDCLGNLPLPPEWLTRSPAEKFSVSPSPDGGVITGEQNPIK